MLNSMKREQPVILVVACLDTKGILVSFLREIIENNGGKALVMDIGFAGYTEIKSDISREEVLKASGKKDHKEKMNKTVLIDSYSEGAGNLALDLYKNGEIDGAISLGGCVGTIMACNVMKRFPIGFPKVVVSTMPYDIRTSLGSSDIMFLYSVADVLGLNPITRMLIKHAAVSVLAMAKLEKPLDKGGKKKKNIGITALGVTTKASEFIYDYLVERGYEVTVFHANGIGGTGFEMAARDGMFDGIIDLTTHEVNHIIFDVPVIKCEDRLKEVTTANVPYIFVPGGLDIFTQGQYADLSVEYIKRPHYIHSNIFTHVRVNGIEAHDIAKYVAGKLNEGIGNIAICIPMKGFSAQDTEGSAIYNKETDMIFVDSLKKYADSNIPFMEVDAHISDREFAEYVCEMLIKMLNI